MARRRGASVLDDCAASNEARVHVAERLWELLVDQIADGRGAKLPDRVNWTVRLVIRPGREVVDLPTHLRGEPLVGEDGRDRCEVSTSVV